MIEREIRERKQDEIVVTRVICDRCGEPLAGVTGIGVPSNWEFKGSYLTGRIYPTSNSNDTQLVAAELCAGCTDRLIAWINRGTRFGTEAVPGARVRTLAEATKEFEASYA